MTLIGNVITFLTRLGGIVNVIANEDSARETGEDATRQDGRGLCGMELVLESKHLRSFARWN